MSDTYEGTCDVCGQAITCTHDRARDGVIDIDVTEDGRIYTWIRHIGGLDPDCSVYFSVVYRVADEPGPAA